MVVHALLLMASLLAPASSGDVVSHDTSAPAAVESVSDDEATTEDAPPPTFNEFLPEDRSITDCISALPRPGCGSEARGGWRQWLVLGAILLGLAFIAWRIARAARRSRPADPAVEQAQAPPADC